MEQGALLTLAIIRAIALLLLMEVLVAAPL